MNNYFIWILVGYSIVTFIVVSTMAIKNKNLKDEIIRLTKRFKNKKEELIADQKREVKSIVSKNDEEKERMIRNHKFEVDSIVSKNDEEKQELIDSYKKEIDFINTMSSNLKATPYMSKLMADYETYGLELLALKLDWGTSQERAKKVKAIREIRRDAQAIVEKNMQAQYNLEYLLSIYPGLEDVIECDYNQLPRIDINELSEYDGVKDYLSKDEYQSLSSCERNQLALDRYLNSHNKTKWQIGRDYELYVGYTFEQKGFSVDYFGSYMGLEDLGRDLIMTKGKTIYIAQCKYWSKHKLIHEKHIAQLYGTVASYIIENDAMSNDVTGILVTNTTLSETAKKMADYLGIAYMEEVEKGSYPCIKCNIGHDEYGMKTKIYHLPFDQQYDSTKISGEGEFFALTVKEAEDAGFRRAFKWIGSN